MRAATVGFPGGQAGPLGVDLVGGHAGGNFYIRARLRAGACVPVVSEALDLHGLWGFMALGSQGLLRVAEPLAVRTLPFAVQIRMSVGCDPRGGVCRRPKAERDTPDLGGRRRSEHRRSDGRKRRETGDFPASR